MNDTNPAADPMLRILWERAKELNCLYQIEEPFARQRQSPVARDFRRHHPHHPPPAGNTRKSARPASSMTRCPIRPRGTFPLPGAKPR